MKMKPKLRRARYPVSSPDLPFLAKRGKRASWASARAFLSDLKALCLVLFFRRGLFWWAK